MSETNTPSQGEDATRPDIEARINELRAAVAGKTSRVTVPLAELRADPETDDDKSRVTIRGHAAVFDRLSEDLGGFREKVKRGAFRKVLDEAQDVRLLVNHDPFPVLARTKSNTLELREDPRGLHVFADVAPTSFAQDLRVSMQRGDIDQMSFGFSVGSDSWMEKDGQIVRTIEEFDNLFDVSIVTFPAYPQTSVDARASDHETNETTSDVPHEELGPGLGTPHGVQPVEVTAESGETTTDEESAPTGDREKVRARRSLADAIVRRYEQDHAA